MSASEQITAQIDFYDAHGLVQRSVAGCWLGQRGASVSIPEGQTRTLVVAMAGEKRNGRFRVPESPPVAESDLAGIHNCIDAFNRGALVTFRAINEDMVQSAILVKITLASRHVSFVKDYELQLDGEDSWIA
jgi:hypothetical protein